MERHFVSGKIETVEGFILSIISIDSDIEPDGIEPLITYPDVLKAQEEAMAQAQKEQEEQEKQETDTLEAAQTDSQEDTEDDNQEDESYQYGPKDYGMICANQLTRESAIILKFSSSKNKDVFPVSALTDIGDEVYVKFGKTRAPGFIEHYSEPVIVYFKNIDKHIEAYRTGNWVLITTPKE